MNIKLNKTPVGVIEMNQRRIWCFDTSFGNIDPATVKSFGEEWKSFHAFSAMEIRDIGDTYFDIVTPGMLGPEMIVADFGCGSGRWSKYIAPKVGAVAAIDPSDAVIAASRLLGGEDKISLYKASIDDLPFEDNYFDFGFSLGVLHHIPDTRKAMESCVRKIKPGGHFLVYLYYNLDNRSFLYRALFFLMNIVRMFVSKLPSKLKRVCCDLLAIFFYMPVILFKRFLKLVGVPAKIRSRLPLHAYENTSFYVIRNDALDRFGTPLEQRFSRQQILEMMESAGLGEIVFSEKVPYWHAVGRKKTAHE